jgi:hypothetical protein
MNSPIVTIAPANAVADQNRLIVFNIWMGPLPPQQAAATTTSEMAVATPTIRRRRNNNS